MTLFRHHMKTLLAYLITAAALTAATTPQGPVVNVSRDRAEIVLNGVWRFQPVGSANQKEPDPAAWGEMPAPGNWVGDWRISLPREPVVRGSGDDWKNFGKPTVAGWYERTLQVPQEWSRHRTLLQVGRVSTDALVWLDNQPIGVLGYLGGEFDLTGVLVPGKASVLRILVVASKSPIQGFSFENPVQPASDGGCASKGLTGDILLINRPSGVRIDHVAALPSVRRSELSLIVGLADFATLTGKEVAIGVRAFDMKSPTPVKSFSATATVDAEGSIRTTFSWKDAHLWDTDDPYLHRLEVTVTGVGIDDQLMVPRFGFREFWVEGRDLFLNGSLIRLRPTEASSASNLAAIRADLARRMQQGNNILEIWPQDSRERGYTHFRQIYAAEASKAGMLLMMPTVKLNEFFNRGDEKFREWIDLARRDWRDYINEPSVVVMVPSGNSQWLAADLNPRWLGRADTPPIHEYQERDWKKMDEANAALKTIDPTRLIMHHQGGPRGDISASNTYLLWAPLQEREEWPSAWADRSQTSVMPFSAIEFGTPLDCSFFRNRNGFGNAYSSEALMTEFAAIYLGPDAYEMESDTYRQELLVKNYQGKDPVSGAARWPLRQNPPAMVTAPAFQEIQRLFQRNTLRTWRTWGLSGGTVPWNEGFSHRPKSYEETAGIQTPGDRGSYYQRIRKTNMAASFHDPVFESLPAAKIQDENQKATLAWIAGKAAQWSERGHHFPSGGNLEKSIALINDSRREQLYHGRWELKRGDDIVAAQEIEGRLGIGQIKWVPVSVTMPVVSAKTDLTLELRATIGKDEHTDSFPLRVWPARKPAAVDVTLFDPVGMTSRLLDRTADELTAKPKKITIIGRQALSSGMMTSDQLAALQPHVEAGNTVVIMAQDPEWMRRWWGFRVCRQVVRRAWPVNPSLPLWQGIDAEDLRDWNNAGTLVDGRPEHNPSLPALFMFRWGNQGSISSAAVEKPHLSGWTPLLQCEFDLQYSPLMELRRGKGRIILCLLDLEDQAPKDPAARALLDRLIQYAADPMAPRSNLFGIAPNDLPPRIAAEPALAAAITAIHSPQSAENATPLEKLIEPLKSIHVEAEQKPWLRFPRWRLTRVEHQLRANLGEEFPADARILNPQCDRLDLSGLWMFRPISRVNAVAGKPLPDPGMNDYHRSLCQPEFDKRLFIEVWQPEALLDDTDGDAILRRRIDLPAQWQGQRLNLELGVMQSEAVVFFNGRPINGGKPFIVGETIRGEVPPEWVDGPRAEIAVRLWNSQGPGGFVNPASTRISIGLSASDPALPLYHPDYRADFKDGDEPYRFFRW